LEPKNLRLLDNSPRPKQFDDSGAAIKVTGSNYDNAYWNGGVMTYGDGSGTYFDILTSIDVAAHEIGHAVCSYTANLAIKRIWSTK
jgi:Zn-dependent metalloprotease